MKSQWVIWYQQYSENGLLVYSYFIVNKHHIELIQLIYFIGWWFELPGRKSQTNIFKSHKKDFFPNQFPTHKSKDDFEMLSAVTWMCFCWGVILNFVLWQNHHFEPPFERLFFGSLFPSNFNFQLWGVSDIKSNPNCPFPQVTP